MELAFSSDFPSNESFNFFFPLSFSQPPFVGAGYHTGKGSPRKKKPQAEVIGFGRAGWGGVYRALGNLYPK